MINKVILVGYIGKDPELKYTPKGTAVLDFSMATTEKYKDQSGQLKEDTEWSSIKIWGKIAETLSKFLSSGSLVYVEGKKKTSKWQDQNGKDRYTTDIIASTVRSLSRKQGDNSDIPF